jgi:hypothetical protein
MNIQQMIKRTALCLLTCCTLAVATTFAQTITHVPLLTFPGQLTNDSFGFAASGTGDVNGDGFDDLIVGAYGDNKNGAGSGSARVLSGIDGNVLYSFDGDSAGDGFGVSVSGAGDVDGDGVDDLIVGAPFDDNNGSDSGSARVLSGVDGSVLYNFDGDSAGDNFGQSVSGAGDVNGDGFDDLIVGAPFDDNNGTDSGRARVLSGVDGSVLFNFDGDSAGDGFGFSLSGAGDVNGDGFDDLIVGASGDDNNGDGSGSARVLSGANGSVLYNFDGDSAGDFFGRAVSDAGDVNGDGFDDLIVGAPPNGSGIARVFSGANGSVLYNFEGDSAGDLFGRSVGGAGDVNGDGFDDLIVGAPRDDNNGALSGSIRVFSGSDGSVLYDFDGDSAGDGFGRSARGVGDVNGDGIIDLIVGAPGDDNLGIDNGSARVFSGADGSVLYNFYGDSAGDIFGRTESDAGDVNGDGTPDLIVGSPLDDNNGSDSGSVRVLSGVDRSVIYSFDGDSAGDKFGTSVSGAGDVNDDGFADLIVGAPLDDNNGAESGSVRVLSGVDGSELYNFDGDSAGDGFGSSVSGAGDVNGDGFSDLIVAAPLDDNSGTDSGSARVYSGVDGSVLYNFDGDSAGDAFGSSVSGPGDVNGDGFDDLIVGARGDDNNGIDSGSARVLSGADGSVLYVFDGDSAGDEFGFSVSGSGDFNGDGLADFFVTAFYGTNNGGYARLFASQIKAALLGDCNQDCLVDMLDITPFIGILSTNSFLTEADCNQDGVVNFLDISPFAAILSGN